MNLNKHTVIYADDDADDRDLVTDAFSLYASNIELLSFENGSAALDYCRQLPPYHEAPCLIILDINMPLMTGKEVLRSLRSLQRYRHTPVILFTTSSADADRDFAKTYGASMVTKPTSFYQLKEIAQQFANACADDIRKKLREMSVV